MEARAKKRPAAASHGPPDVDERVAAPRALAIGSRKVAKLSGGRSFDLDDTEEESGANGASVAIAKAASSTEMAVPPGDDDAQFENDVASFAKFLAEKDLPVLIAFNS